MPGGPGSGAARQLVELAGLVECVEVVEAADVVVADEDLRHGASPAAAGQHDVAVGGILVQLKLIDEPTLEKVVQELWDDLRIVEGLAELAVLKKKPEITEKLAPFKDEEVLAAIRELKLGKGSDRPVKQVEIEALLSVPEGYGDDIPIDPNFHARRLPEQVWRKTDRFGGVASVIQLHRLREVMALIGFTRLEAVISSNISP